MKTQYEKYYVLEQSYWPIVGAVALFLIAVGAGLAVMQTAKQEGGVGFYVLC